MVATHQTVIGLLAVTGMRVGEALGLNDDVDFDTGRRLRDNSLSTHWHNAINRAGVIDRGRRPRLPDPADVGTTRNALARVLPGQR